VSTLWPKTLPGVASFSGGPHDLTDKALWSRRSAPFVADATGTNTQVIFRLFHQEFKAA
jgi:hypothetical protein